MRYLLAHDFACDLLIVDMNLGEDSLAGCDLVKNRRNVHKMITQVIVGINRDSATIATQFLVAGADSAWKKPLPGPLVVLSRINKLLHIRRCLYGGVVGLL
jgi:DNA-binding response OmpR family regulator